MSAECTIQYDTKKRGDIYVFIEKQILVSSVMQQHQRNCLGVFIAPDMVLFSSYKYQYFSDFCMKTYVMGVNWKCLAEALLMSTHNICFCAEISK